MTTTRTLDYYNGRTEKELVATLFGDVRSTTYHSSEVYRPKKKVYAVLEDDETCTLRAMKVLKVYYSPSFMLFYVDIAGYGRTYTTDYYCFDSKEDYLANKYSYIWDKDAPLLNMVNAVTDFGYPVIDNRLPSETRFYIRKWGWEKNHSTYVESKFVVAYDVEMNKTSVIDIDDPRFPYRTEADAIKANEVAVCEFEDEDGQKEFDVMVEVIKSVSTSVKAKDAKSVLETAKTAFGGVENFKVFINGELSYESK